MSISEMERSGCSTGVSSLPHRLPSLWDSFQHAPPTPCHGYSCAEIQKDLLKVTLEAPLKRILSSGLDEETPGALLPVFSVTFTQLDTVLLKSILGLLLWQR